MSTDDLRGRLWLWLPFFLAYIFDHTLTLVAQPVEYWRGSYFAGSEWNPIARWFLISHPLAFIGYSLVELVVVAWLITVFPEIAAKILSAAYTITSVNAIYDWLTWHYHKTFFVASLPLIIASILLVYAFERASESKRSSFKLNNRYTSPSRR